MGALLFRRINIIHATESTTLYLLFHKQQILHKHVSLSHKADTPLHCDPHPPETPSYSCPPPRANITLAPSLRRRMHPIRHLRLHIRNHPQQIPHDLIPRLASSLPDRLQLRVGILARVFFGFLVAARLLLFVFCSVSVGQGEGKGVRGERGGKPSSQKP